MNGLRYSIVSPGGNSTLLVESDVEEQNRAPLSKACMNTFSAEQVGFLQQSSDNGIDAHVQLMGNEFSMNTVRSVAALLFKRNALRNPVVVSCSGALNPITCSNTDLDERSTFTEATMETSSDMVECDDHISLVRLDGIAHFVCDLDAEHRKDIAKLGMEDFYDVFERFKTLVDEFPAVGVVFYQKQRRGHEIRPMVFVRETATVTKETGCGSGSVALAIALMRQDARRVMQVMQPSKSAYKVAVERTSERDMNVSVGGSATLVIDRSIWFPSWGQTGDTERI